MEKSKFLVILWRRVRSQKRWSDTAYIKVWFMVRKQIFRVVRKSFMNEKLLISETIIHIFFSYEKLYFNLNSQVFWKYLLTEEKFLLLGLSFVPGSYFELFFVWWEITAENVLLGISLLFLERDCREMEVELGQSTD